MSTPSSTSNTGTGIRPEPQSPARSRFDQEPLWRPGPHGPIFTGDSISPETTDTFTRDCEFELIMSAESPHPIAITCGVHDWTGEIS